MGIFEDDLTWTGERTRGRDDRRHEAAKLYVIPISCWRPREGTGIPADAQMYPPCCNWQCQARDEEFG